ncbi:MAG TPA: hypothetical protein VFE63_12775 [Roseiarcus sp.]|jgi:hypothetical protein|nr:hypothetical protein [Roseiarcus sp.]
MTEFDKLRALLDAPLPEADVAEARALFGRRTPRRWARLLWKVLVVATALDAIYLLTQTLRPI